MATKALKPGSDFVPALAKAFEAENVKLIERQIAWGLQRAKALAEFEASDERKNWPRSDIFGLYARRFSIAGGKGWYGELHGQNDAGVRHVMIDLAQQAIDARNRAIAAKLVKCGVTSIGDHVFSRTADGYQGVFSVTTDQGVKTAHIKVIVAGGYNIQCLHERHLVRIG